MQIFLSRFAAVDHNANQKFPKRSEI